jgi:hypothetical protein
VSAWPARWSACARRPPGRSGRSARRVWRSFPSIAWPVAERLKYLPFWVLAAGAGADARRFFAPAFRFRRLKFLADLARKLSGADPAWTPSTLPPPELHGCHYDAEDAVLLARFTEIGLGREPEPSFTRASLAWFPFWNEHHTWRDPFTGLALPEDLLV